MKRFRIILLLLIIPVSLQAQAIGQVPWGARVFSTGFPASIPDEYFEDGGPKMSKERREIAIKCVEKTFGKVKEYNEYWGNCTGEHMFIVTLESGDEINQIRYVKILLQISQIIEIKNYLEIKLKEIILNKKRKRMIMTKRRIEIENPHF